MLIEFQALYDLGWRGTLFVVDDNFIGNKKNVRNLLPELAKWQKERGYPVHFAFEATLNIANMPDLLEMMREAYFTTIFCGIETPELPALGAMAKQHNLAIPLLEGVAILNKYGMEVVSGIIMGLDSDRLDTGERIASIEFKDLVDVCGIVGIIVKHDIVSAVTLEKPPVLGNADRYRIHTQLANALSVMEALFPAPVAIFTHHRAQLWPVAA